MATAAGKKGGDILSANFATTLLVNGKFITMEDDMPFAEALAIRDNRILYIGTDNEARKLASLDTEVIDLRGKTAIPGLIESHTHPTYYAQQLSGLKLSGTATTSLKALLRHILEAAKQTPKGAWICGYGWDESKFDEGPILLTKEILDTAAPEHPVFIRRTCGHIGVLNTMAMKQCGFSDQTPDPDGGHFFRSEGGELTGMISGSVQSLVPTPSLRLEHIKECFATTVQEEYFMRGITTTAEMEVEARFMRMLQELHHEKRLKLRIRVYESARKITIYEARLQSVIDLGLMPGFGDDTLSFLGMKYVMDGSAGGKTAAFSLPYKGEPDNYGELYNDQDELNEDMLKTAKAGLQAAIHAIGDRAIEAALLSVEYANAHGIDTRPLRFRFEHVESPTTDQIERMRQLEILVGSSSAFIYSLGDAHFNVLGQERLFGAFPIRTFMEKGMTVACNSDCPVCDVNPMLGIYSMVCRKTQGGHSFGEEESIDRMRALAAYTRNAARLLFAEEKIGTLRAGKFADIVVLNDDYMSVIDEKLKEITVAMTMVGGQVVYGSISAVNSNTPNIKNSEKAN